MNQITGLEELEIPKDIIQECPNYYCIPASLLFILKYHYPNFLLSQLEIYQKMNFQPNFENAKTLSSSDFEVDYSGFPLGNCSNGRETQFGKWKEFIIKELEKKRPVAVCFKNEGCLPHCKVFFQKSNDSFKIFNPGTRNRNLNILKSNSVISATCLSCNCNEAEYYSGIEIYKFSDAFVDLQKNILQMQILTVKPIS